MKPHTVTTRCGNTACVQVDVRSDGVYVSSTLNPTARPTFFTHAEWEAFIAAVKDGQFDSTVEDDADTIVLAGEVPA